MITWAQTYGRMRADKERFLEYTSAHSLGRPLFAWTHPSYQAVCLHRISHYFFARKRRLLARVFWHINLILTGADISPICDIGGGLVIMQPLGCIMVGNAGKNCTLQGSSGFGGGMSRKDIGSGPGLPCLGDDVLLEFGAVVLGPVRIGDRSRIGARCMVSRDVPADSIVHFREPRMGRRAVAPRPRDATADRGVA